MDSLKFIKNTLNFLKSCENEETRAACIKSIEDHVNIIELEFKKQQNRSKKYEKKISQLVEILNPQMNFDGFDDD